MGTGAYSGANCGFGLDGGGELPAVFVVTGVGVGVGEGEGADCPPVTAGHSIHFACQSVRLSKPICHISGVLQGEA